MIGSLFFEVEGVIAATAPLRRAALLRALAEEGIENAGSPDDDAKFSVDSVRDTREVVRLALGRNAVATDETAVTLIALRADRHFASLMQAGVSLMPGARELLEMAAARCRLAIVTGLTRATVESMLSLADLTCAVEVIIAAEDVSAPKPAPDGYRKALDRMIRRRPLDLCTAVALESGSAGARAARAVGIRCAVVAPNDIARSYADATLTTLVGETPATLGAMLSVRAVG